MDISKLKWLDDYAEDLKGKLVLVRADLNVPIETGEITDDFRIISSLPTIEYLSEHGARVVVISHLGRPKGKVKKQFSLEPIAVRLQSYLRKDIIFSDDCIGDGLAKIKAQLSPGQIMLCENLRFHSGETKNTDSFAEALAEQADLFVFDAFGVAHREHASVVGLAAKCPETVGGLLVKKEVLALSRLVAFDRPERLTAILGGAKVSDKIAILNKLIDKADEIIIGGAMAYTFLAAKMEDVGASRVEADRLALARSMLNQCELKNTRVYLPVDHIVSTEFSEQGLNRVVEKNQFKEDEMGLDIGPQTQKMFADVIERSEMVLWNGPMGVFEWDAYAAGTKSIATAMKKADAFTVVGGGDSAAAVLQMGFDRAFSHISTGGGASLSFLEGTPLPGLQMLQQ